jgi:hypothetical protein
MQSERRQRTEAQEWCFRLMNDPEYFEKCRYTDAVIMHINITNSDLDTDKPILYMQTTQAQTLP